MLAHNVYFTLKDPSEAARDALIAACKTYLTSQPGIILFACGGLVQDLDRPVNDRDFDIALHLVFESREAHDQYQDHPLHLRFVEENKPNWAKVRVFDSEVEGGVMA